MIRECGVKRKPFEKIGLSLKYQYSDLSQIIDHCGLMLCQLFVLGIYNNFKLSQNAVHIMMVKNIHAFKWVFVGLLLLRFRVRSKGSFQIFLVRSQTSISLLYLITFNKYVNCKIHQISRFFPLSLLQRRILYCHFLIKDAIS